MEVGFPLQGDRLPALTGIAGLDQAEKWRQILAPVGVARAHEAVRAHDRERHRVLVAARHPLRLALIVGRPEETVWVAMKRAWSAGLMPRPWTWIGPESSMTGSSTTVGSSSPPHPKAAEATTASIATKGDPWPARTSYTS